MNCNLNIVKGLSTEVRTRMKDSQELTGRFFLSDQSRNHYGEETLLDLLNNPEKKFVPFTQSGQAPVLLIQKSEILSLQANENNCQEWAAVIHMDESCWPPTRVIFDGFSLEGKAYTGDLQPERRRLTDLLNQDQDFFILKTEDSPWIINKTFIKYLEPQS